MTTRIFCEIVAAGLLKTRRSMRLLGQFIRKVAEQLGSGALGLHECRGPCLSNCLARTVEDLLSPHFHKHQ